MNLRHSISALVLFAAVASPFSGAGVAQAAQVWSGRTFTFTKAANADPNLAANQDRITSNVWITRGAVQGIYNIKQEAASSGSLGNSPVDTEWATGDAANYASLTFDTWVGWAGGFPPGTVGVNAVMHLISEDIYIDVRFNSWGSGALGGGAFSYTRAVAPGATPTDSPTWGALKALYR
jgi:hypothetical protein